MDLLETQTQYIIFLNKYLSFEEDVFHEEIRNIGLDPDDVNQFDVFYDGLFFPCLPEAEEIEEDGETYVTPFPFDSMATSINTIRLAACRYSTCRTEHMLLDEPCGKHYQRLYEALKGNSIFLWSESDEYKSFLLDWTDDYAFNFEEITSSIRKQNTDEGYGFSSSELDKLNNVVSTYIEKTRQLIDKSRAEGALFINLYNLTKLYCKCRGPGRLKECREELLGFVDICNDLSELYTKA